MHDSRLIRLLKSFSKQEILEFEKFLESPLFNNSEHISAFYRFIKKYYPAFDGSKFTPEEAFRFIYPRERFNKNKISQLLTKTLSLAENFLTFKRFTRMDISRMNMLLKEFAERDIPDLFADIYRKTENELNANEIKDGSYLYLRYSLMQTRRNYYESKIPVGKREQYFREIQSEFNSFVIYASYKLLKYYIELHTHRKLLNQNYIFSLEDSVISFISNNPAEDYPVIMIYYYLVLLNRNENDFTSYSKAVKLINENIDSIQTDDLIKFYAMLYNFTRIHATRGNKDMEKENFRITKEMIARDIHPLDGNFFAENSFLTIFRTAMIEGDIKWGYEFMNKYLNRLPQEKQDNVFRLCSGIYNYYIGDYDKALEFLSRVKINDFIYGIRVKNFQVRCMWMKGYYEEVSYAIDSFRHMLYSNDKIPEYPRKRFINFLNFLERATKYVLSEQYDRFVSLTRELEKRPDEEVENKRWLLECFRKFI
jgi:hypothetical protein